MLGIINQLPQMEWRWIDGGPLGCETGRSEERFAPGPDLTVQAALAS